MNEIRYASGCSGIGGFELGFQRAGGFKRVWSCDWDYDETGKKAGYYANKIYRRHFKPRKGTHAKVYAVTSIIHIAESPRKYLMTTSAVTANMIYIRRAAPKKARTLLMPSKMLVTLVVSFVIRS